MSRFKQLWSSFWRKDQGIGMIEAAILLPIFVMFIFAVMDFGNFMIVKNRIVSANQAIASAIQNNPTMTAGAWGSGSDLEKVIQNSLRDLWFKNGSYVGYTGVSVWASKTVPTIETATGWGTGKLWQNRDITNPWLSDSDPSNDNNAYYVGVYVWRGVPWVTPLPKFVNLENIDPDNLAFNAPNGRKAVGSFTFVTLGGISCPADQVVQSMTGGVGTCVPRDNNYSCASGQVLEKIVDGKPVCVAKDGTYTCASDQVLKEIRNDANGAAAVCVNRDGDFNCGDYQLVQKRVDNQLFCGDPRINYVCTGDQVLQATYATGPVLAVCVDKDHGGLSCLPGQVVTGVISGVPTCSAAPLPSYGVFGGMYAISTYHAEGQCQVGNPFTGGCTCPAWAPSVSGPFPMDSGRTYQTRGGGGGNVYITHRIIHHMYVCAK